VFFSRIPGLNGVNRSKTKYKKPVMAWNGSFLLNKKSRTKWSYIFCRKSPGSIIIDGFVVEIHLGLHMKVLLKCYLIYKCKVGDMYSTWRCCWNVASYTNVKWEICTPHEGVAGMLPHFSSTFMWSTYLPLYICIWGNIPATPSCGVHISHFTFVYEVTFQQHLHVEYISPTWYDIRLERYKQLCFL
jgi:hypothetical protein